MPDAPAPPPPGWYADPAHQHGSRWWDGTGWTDHVRALPANDDPPPPPVTPQAGSVGWHGRGRGTTRVMTTTLAIGLVAAIAVGIGVAGRGDPVAAVLDPVEVRERREAAGCTTVVDGEPLEDRRHLDPAEAPPAAALYPQRPAHSGRHHPTLLAAPDAVAVVPIDERAVLHNMEHGSVVVWFDPDAVTGRERASLGDWRDARADAGFASRAGGAVFASPMPADLTGGAGRADGDAPPPVALRAWGVAVDCERFDPVVADAFLAEHWGSHGQAPEAELSPYPDGVVRFAERA